MDGWDLYYECVDRELGRQMERHLHLFRESLEWWLHAEVNWPSRDWEVQLQHLVDHTRYYGLEIHPVSIQSLHDLVEARVNGTGPFESLGPYCWDEPAVATGEPIQLAVAVGLDDGTRTDAEPAMHQEIKAGETDFERKLTEAQGHLDEMGQVLEALGQKLDAAKLKEDVEVEPEVDAIEELIWRYNDALESAQDTWLRDDLSGDAIARLHQMQSPRGLGLPGFTDELQAQRIMKQGMQISRRMSGRDASMDRLVFGMQAAEVAGNAAGFVAGGILIKAAIKGGTWTVVKTIAVAGAAIAAEQGAEAGLRAAGAGEPTIRGVRLAAIVVSLIIFHRKNGSKVAEPSKGSGPEPPTTPKAATPGSPRPAEPSGSRNPFDNQSGNPEDAARAARTQPRGNAPTRSGAATSTRLVRGDDPSRLNFQGIEVRAVRDLSHLDDATLKAMQQQGFAARDINGKRLDLHHLNQNPIGPLVEIPAPRHSIKNPIQHPLGKQAGVGLTAEQRAAFNKFRKEYWKARATEELQKRESK